MVFQWSNVQLSGRKPKAHLPAGGRPCNLKHGGGRSDYRESASKWQRRRWNRGPKLLGNPAQPDPHEKFLKKVERLTTARGVLLSRF